MFTDNQNKAYMLYMIKRFGNILLVLLLVYVPVTAFGQNMIQNSTITSASRTRVVEKIAKQLKDKYVFPDKAKEMADFITGNLKSGAYDTLSEAMFFAEALTMDLQSISHDKHLRVRFNPEVYKQLTNPEGTPDGNDEKMFAEQMKRENYGFKKADILAGNIGYIDFRNFAQAEYSKEKVASVMNFVAGCDALIFDIRQNGGGAPDGVQLICSYLFGKEPVHLNDLYFRDGDRTEEFWTLRKVDGEKRPDVPVYVLTSKYTFSGAEEFAYNLKNLKRATIVGETTGGGANPGGMVPAKDGFIIFIPNGRAINPITKTNWEGTGVTPDVEIASDKALEKAQVLALGKISESVKDEAAKGRYKWLLESIESVMNAKPIDIKTLESYAGEYSDRTITFEGGSLYYQRKGRPKFQMTAMNDDTFMFRDLEYFRIKFERDSNGKVTGLTAMYDDGHTDSSARTN